MRTESRMGGGRSGDGRRGGKPGPGGRGPKRNFSGGGEPRDFRPRRKMNRFYTIFPQGATSVDYKDTDRLFKFLTEKGKIVPRRTTGLTAKQQRALVRAIKRARHAGLIGFQKD